MNKSDFHFDLPPELIAQQPLPRRSASRLLLLPSGDSPLQDRRVDELPALLQSGDLLVFNDTRVLAARLFGRKESGGRVEILIERVLDAHTARVQLNASKRSRPGTRITLDEDAGIASVLGRDGEFYLLTFEGEQSLPDLLQRAGRMPLPPYINRAPDDADAERYQTVFARAPGAVAAPTAGLHFDDDLLAALQARGVETTTLTLHVGAGTFQPMRSDSIEQHLMHSEWLSVGQETIDRIGQTRARGGRVIAVGTTVVRALESALVDDVLQPFEGETRIFIYPGYRIRSVDALLTNFHLPESTLLMLVSAFAGRERVIAAYQHAIEQRYRFFSYGDAMLLFPQAFNPESST
ncbi:MAG: tRNA preQ1(34) S-adenosylmethionine ribosyltransferase-isomerase QueA [Lysobacteraceae bacterium]